MASHLNMHTAIIQPKGTASKSKVSIMVN